MTHSVDESLKRGEVAVLTDGEHVHVAASTAIEVARGCVVDGVVLPPAVVRGQGQDRESPAEHVVCRFRFEEGSVAAIVLQDEQANQKSGRRKRQDKREQIRVLHAETDQDPKHQERAEG
jgi:hypothetical protein